MILQEITVENVFHGTSEKAWEKIQRSGKLTPQKEPHSFFRGNASTLFGITEKQIYLTGASRKAQYYAEEQATHANSTPVVLQISTESLDIEKCFPDDDELVVMLANSLNTVEENVIEMFKEPTAEFAVLVKNVVDKWQKRPSRFKDHFAYQGEILLKNIHKV